MKIVTYKFLEDIAVADIAFEAEAPTLEELFVDAGKALIDSMVNPEALTQGKKRKVSLTADSLEHLLFDWLAELIYLKDVEQELFTDFKVRLEHPDESYTLKASMKGIPIKDVLPENLRNDVKAVTMHQFKLEKISSGFRARAVLDI